MRSIAPAPESVVSKGKFNFGCYDQPIRKINMLEARLDLPFFKSLQLREWQAFQILTEGHFFFVALYNTKKVSLVQFIHYDIKNSQKHRFERKVLSSDLHLPNGLYQSTAYYRSPNCYIQAKHDLEGKKLTLEVDIKQSKKTPAIYARFLALHDTENYRPMVVVLPFSENRAMYSHKCLMPVEGEAMIGTDRFKLHHSQSSLILDDHKGFYPYVTKYDWVTGLGFSEKGERMGFNLTDNQVKNQELYNENALWIDGGLHLLPPVSISRPQGPKGTWLIKDQEGAVDLQFLPITHTSVNLNLLVLKSKYEGPYGYFQGTIKKENGDPVKISNFFGVGEDFYLRS